MARIEVVLACLAYVVLTASGAPYDDSSEEISLPGIILPSLLSPSLTDDPKPCCLPKQWQGNVTGQSAFTPGRRGEADDSDDVDRRGGRRGGFQAGTTTIYVDEDKKSVAGKVACRNDTCGFLVVFGANDTAKTFLYAMGAQKCWSHKSNRAKFHSQCIPANSTFEGSVKVGPASGGLDVQVWRFGGRPHHNGSAHGGVFVSGRALVTADKCIPVIFQNHGFIAPGPRPDPPQDSRLLFQTGSDPNPRPRPGPRGGFMGSSYFTNVEPSVKDPSVFTPPSYCNTTTNTLEVGVEMDYPDILDRFVTLY